VFFEMKEKKTQYYYNSEEYAERLAEIDEEIAHLRQIKEEEAKEKAKRVKRETLRLKKIFTEERCGKENMHFVRALIDRAAFLRVEIEFIEQSLQSEGMMDFFVQGTQTLWREHPLSKVHVQHSKSYRETIKQLESYLQDSSASSKHDGNPLTSPNGLIARGNAAREKYKQ
jgi:hypothetical protein